MQIVRDPESMKEELASLQREEDKPIATAGGLETLSQQLIEQVDRNQ
jgi:hypothetical protein